MPATDRKFSVNLPSKGLLAVAAILVLSCGSSANAQSAADGTAAAPETRAQVKMELAEFRKTHTWDPLNETWVLKPGFEPPEGAKTRAQVKADRDDFLRKNSWDALTETWVPVNGAPRNLSTLTRSQVKVETAQFMRTHKWDETTEMWVDRQLPVKKGKKVK